MTEYELKVLGHASRGELIEIPGAATNQAIECLRGHGYMTGFHITKKGRHFLKTEALALQYGEGEPK